eukprot:COSAG06_NODE_1840_length_8239_cov_3.113145_4_plen_57_part_00
MKQQKDKRNEEDEEGDEARLLERDEKVAHPVQVLVLDRTGQTQVAARPLDREIRAE